MGNQVEFADVMRETSRLCKQLKRKTITLSDYYFKLADFFNQIEPSEGIHEGKRFDFNRDAKELIRDAKIQLMKEREGVKN